MAFDINSMLDKAVYNHTTKNIELIETHISWVLLTGEFAYKIKKPVNFGFLDFSTLDKRLHCCKEEVRLNSRLAPEIYLNVVAISERRGQIIISTDHQAPIEHAIKMLQFPQAAQLDRLLESEELTLGRIDEVARMIAIFHQQSDVASASNDFGNAASVFLPVEENFTQIAEQLDSSRYTPLLNRLEQWSRSTHDRLTTVFENRKTTGFIRECHGDLHLRNLIWLYNRPMAFDCIEFNAYLRWIDVLSDSAFLIMDLQHNKKFKLSYRLLNTYLEITGDYSGISVMPFYLCYRAMVRAKVSALRLAQEKLSDNAIQSLNDDLGSYLAMAESYTHTNRQTLFIMHGVSASGKSSVSQALVDITGAIRIRSDVERKRLFEINIDTNASTSPGAGIYSVNASQMTYKRLCELASDVISAGYNVVVDAAFLNQTAREDLYQLANSLGASYIVMHTFASEKTLRQRIIDRKNDVSDANLDILNDQLANYQPLDEIELRNTIAINTEDNLDIDSISKQIESYQARSPHSF